MPIKLIVEDATKALRNAIKYRIASLYAEVLLIRLSMLFLACLRPSFRMIIFILLKN